MGTPSNDLNISQAGIVVFDGTATFLGRTLTAGSGITISNGSGVSGNPTISLTGGGLAIDSIAVQTGVSPIVPDTAGLITINGSVVSAGTNPIRTDGTSANAMAIEVQISQAIASTNATKIGLCNFNSTFFSVDANGFVTATGTTPISFLTDANGPAVPSSNSLGVSGQTTAGAAISIPIYTEGVGSTLKIWFTNTFPPVSTSGVVSVTASRFAYAISGGGTLSLPQAGTAGIGLGKTYYIYDANGSAASTNITINAFAGDNINGLSSIVLNQNYQSVTLVYASTNTWIIQ